MQLAAQSNIYLHADPLSDSKGIKYQEGQRHQQILSKWDAGNKRKDKSKRRLLNLSKFRPPRLSVLAFSILMNNFIIKFTENFSLPIRLSYAPGTSCSVFDLLLSETCISYRFVLYV